MQNSRAEGCFPLVMEEIGIAFQAVLRRELDLFIGFSLFFPVSKAFNLLSVVKE